jgi:hypothetical protein
MILTDALFNSRSTLEGNTYSVAFMIALNAMHQCWCCYS